ncbi:hypothetical protein AFB00_20595 [Pseudonocardia sp. HH130630-07]|nr:hypothetical protein AFB00_20595 [Pseudonocardia sp. HH130630-07]
MLVALLVLLTSSCAAGPDPCHVAAADVGTASGWVGYAARHPDDVAFVFDDGRGTRVEHRADEVQPFASSIKVLNLVPYTREVALGRVRADEPVRLGDWERWSSAGSEESHAAALDALGISRTGMRASDQGATVPIDRVADAMNTFSDNAAPDFLRARLGDRALVDAARDYGWGEVGALPTNTGFLIGQFVPELVPAGATADERRRRERDAARRFASDPAFRADVDTRPLPPGLDVDAYNGSGPGGTARQLTALWRGIGEGRLPGAAHARTITERSSRPGFVGVGAKGGLTTGAVVSRGTELRRADGTVATGVLLVRRMSRAGTDRAAATPGLDDVTAAAAEDPQVVRRWSCDLFG